MQQRYLMTSCTVGNFGKDYNVCPVPKMPDGDTCGWKLVHTTVTVAEHKQNLFLFTWTWERL